MSENDAQDHDKEGAGTAAVGDSVEAAADGVVLGPSLDRPGRRDEALLCANFTQVDLPGQQLLPVRLVPAGWGLLEQRPQVLVGVDPAELGVLGEGVDQRTGLGSGRRIGEKPAAGADRQRTGMTLGRKYAISHLPPYAQPWKMRRNWELMQLGA